MTKKKKTFDEQLSGAMGFFTFSLIVAVMFRVCTGIIQYMNHDSEWAYNRWPILYRTAIEVFIMAIIAMASMVAFNRLVLRLMQYRRDYHNIFARLPQEGSKAKLAQAEKIRALQLRPLAADMRLMCATLVAFICVDVGFASNFFIQITSGLASAFYTFAGISAEIMSFLACLLVPWFNAICPPEQTHAQQVREGARNRIMDKLMRTQNDAADVALLDEIDPLRLAVQAMQAPTESSEDLTVPQLVKLWGYVNSAAATRGIQKAMQAMEQEGTGAVYRQGRKLYIPLVNIVELKRRVTANNGDFAWRSVARVRVPQTAAEAQMIMRLVPTSFDAERPEAM